MFLTMIVDSNEEDVVTLQRIISKIIPDATLVICNDVEDALEYLTSGGEKVDVFFISIKTHTGNGCFLAEEIRKKNEYFITPIVFVSDAKVKELNAYQKYHCYGFIYKPYGEQEVVKYISKLLESIRSKKHDQLICRTRTIEINTKDGVVFVDLDDILSIEVIGKECTVYTVNKKIVVSRTTLGKLINQINNPHIIRCHRSFAVNVRNLSHLVKKKRDLWQPIFSHATDENICFISATYYDQVMSCVKNAKTNM